MTIRIHTRTVERPQGLAVLATCKAGQALTYASHEQGQAWNHVRAAERLAKRLGLTWFERRESGRGFTFYTVER